MEKYCRGIEIDFSIGVEFMCDRVGRTTYKEYPPPSLKPKSKNFSKFSAFKQKFLKFLPAKVHARHSGKQISAGAANISGGAKVFRVGRLPARHPQLYAYALYNI